MHPYVLDCVCAYERAYVRAYVCDTYSSNRKLIILHKAKTKKTNPL